MQKQGTETAMADYTAQWIRLSDKLESTWSCSMQASHSCSLTSTLAVSSNRLTVLEGLSTLKVINSNLT